MALIKCPDCGKEVSDVAPACPNCGRPIAQQQNKRSFRKTQTIQMTAKRFKVAKLVGLFLLLLGFFVYSNILPEIGCALLIIGCLIILYGIFGKWWHHE